MKKLIALLLAAVMVLSLCACGKTEAPAAAPEAPATPAAPAAPAESSDAQAGEYPDFSGRSLLFGVWGGSFADAALKSYVDPFNKLTGANVTIEEYGSDVTVKVVQQYEQGIEGYDVISGCGVLDQMAVMADHGAIIELDYSKLPNSKYVEACYEYCVGQYIISTIIAWNKDVYGDNPPDTIAKYYDTVNYPGNRAEVNYSNTGGFEQMALGLGWVDSLDQCYPLPEDRCYAFYDEIGYKDSVVLWWDSNAQIRQALADGEVDCGHFWGGAVIESIVSDGMTNIGMSNEYASLITDCMAICSTCKDPELAYAFLNYCLSAEAQASWTNLKYYLPVNSEAIKYVNPEIAPYLELPETAFYCDVPYWQQNFEAHAARYMEYISK